MHGYFHNFDFLLIFFAFFPTGYVSNMSKNNIFDSGRTIVANSKSFFVLFPPKMWRIFLESLPPIRIFIYCSLFGRTAYVWYLAYYFVNLILFFSRKRERGNVLQGPQCSWRQVFQSIFYLVLNPSMMIHPALLEWLYDEKPFPKKTWLYPLISYKSKFFSPIYRCFSYSAACREKMGCYGLALTLQAFPGIVTFEYVDVI